jgi:hypothetical protein
MSEDQLVTPCGRYESGSCKPFTEETLKQHELDCPACQLIALGIDPSDNIDEESDGVYWAMQLEKEGWFP